MADGSEHPALERLARLDRPDQRRRTPERQRPTARKGMGYQPSLDGLRGLSVLMIIVYHAGFAWAHGGFISVELFFVVSGFLITSLLIEERDGTGRVSLWQFWVRRWRRLLPALFAMLVFVGVWAVFFGTAEQHSQLRRDYPWGIFYLANWGQVFSQVPYFSATPTLFRHLWTLAVEEQWYLIWPAVFMAFALRRGDDRRRGARLAMIAASVMGLTAFASLIGAPTRWLNPMTMNFESVDTTNFLYLSTFTRCTGLLLGAGLAFVWRPWNVQADRPHQGQARVLSLAATAATVVLLVSFAFARVTSGSTYVIVLPLVTIACTVLVGVVVHPWAATPRRLCSARWIVEIGKRSYGLYLFSWPISRMVGAYEGAVDRFVLAMVLSVVFSEACYRWIETPIRKGVLGRWWAQRQRADWRMITGCAVASAVFVAVPLAWYYRSADPVYDAAVDRNGGVVFDPDAALGSTTVAPTDSVQPSDTGPGPTVTIATLPRRMVIVGDSTAHSLAVNLPAGIESTFDVADGSVEGCSVYDSGTAVSSRNGFTRNFAGCNGWDSKWTQAAQQLGAEVALVAIGAWDVFDVKTDAGVLAFGSAQSDARLIAGLEKGIAALAATGAKVALLEVPCMRPQDVKGAGVPALPERGDDARVAHVNDVLRQVAAAHPESTVFVTGPQEYCTDPAIASDLAYRWDGVHAYKPGANLTLQAITRQVLEIPVP